MLSCSPAPQRKANKKGVSGSTSGGQNIKVFVRVRPMNDNEKYNKAHSVVDCPTSKEIIVLERPYDKYTKKFSFDKVFDGKSKQADIYKSVAKPLVEEVLNGFNCTIFAYGQTGTGKTFTMEGDQCLEGASLDENHSAGIIPRCVNQLFDELRIQKLEFTMRVSFLELYNEELFDLLSAHDDLSKLRLYEDSSRKGSCIIQGLEEVLVRSKSDVYSIIDKGSAKRQTAATLMNAHSSRSHTVFTVTIHIKENTLDGDELLKTGKLHLVDLAGSENIGRSGAVDKRAREAGNINQSLLTLGRVITSLVEKAPHIPYRESKLTRLLQDALGGRTKTSIIATISPASVSLEETLSTLDYAHRAKNIQNKPEVNQKLNKKELICEYTIEIEKLRRDLLAMREKNGVYLANENYQEIISTMEQQAQEITEKISQIRMLENEMEKQIELFTEVKEELKNTSQKLSSTESKLSKTKEVLQCTQKLLSYTASERDEQTYLVSAHVKTENELQIQGMNLVNVAQTTTTDIRNLQDKLDRQRKVESLNEEVGKAFGREFEERVSAMHSSVFSFKEHHQRNSAVVVEELGKYLRSSQSDMERMSDQLGTMNESMLEALHECYTIFEQKVNLRKDKTCAFSDTLIERTEKEEIILNQFMEVLHPLVSRMTLLLLQQHDSVHHLRENIESKMNAMSRLCESVHEEESTLLASMETRLAQLSDFPALFVKQMNGKSKFLEEKTKAHSQVLKTVLKKITLEFLAEIESQEKLMALQFPLITSDQEKSLSRVQQSTKELVREVATLSELSSKHKVKSLEKEKEGKTSLLGDVTKIALDTKELEKELSDMKEKVDKQMYETRSALCDMLKLTQDSKEETVKSIESSKVDFKKEVQDTCGNISSQFESHGEEMLAAKMKMETVVTDFQQRLSRSESELEEFLTDHNDQLRESGEGVQTLLSQQLMKDLPTGQTPVRREYSYSQSLMATSPHERLLSRYRNKINCGSKIPLPTFVQGANEELGIVGDSSSSSDSCNSSVLSEVDKITSGGAIEHNFALPLSLSASFKDDQSVFALPSAPLRQENKENSVSRSSSASSLTDSKENLNIDTVRVGSMKKRELKLPSTTTVYNTDKIGGDLPETRARKILGPFN